jgi:hypothetical protein
VFRCADWCNTMWSGTNAFLNICQTIEIGAMAALLANLLAILFDKLKYIFILLYRCIWWLTPNEKSIHIIDGYYRLWQWQLSFCYPGAAVVSIETFHFLEFFTIKEEFRQIFVYKGVFGVEVEVEYVSVIGDWGRLTHAIIVKLLCVVGCFFRADHFQFIIITAYLWFAFVLLKSHLNLAQFTI